MTEPTPLPNEVSDSMLKQEEIQKKIEAFAQIDENIRLGKKPF